MRSSIGAVTKMFEKKKPFLFTNPKCDEIPNGLNKLYQFFI